MPFGLTIVPSTFQVLMNMAFKPYLRKFVLVFFDDMLVFSQNLDLHLQHLKIVLGLLLHHQLYAKRIKCAFGNSEVEYLGHITFAQVLSTDPKKNSTMMAWHSPTSIKALKGFLGLTSYYKNFIHNYGGIAAPLTTLLKKNSFLCLMQLKLLSNNLNFQ